LGTLLSIEFSIYSIEDSGMKTNESLLFCGTYPKLLTVPSGESFLDAEYYPLPV
jgi:hypothetical protein